MLPVEHPAGFPSLQDSPDIRSASGPDAAGDLWRRRPPSSDGVGSGTLGGGTRRRAARKRRLVNRAETPTPPADCPAVGDRHAAARLPDLGTRLVPSAGAGRQEPERAAPCSRQWSRQMRTQGTSPGKRRGGLLGHRREEGPSRPRLQRRAPAKAWKEGEQRMDEFTPETAALPLVVDPDIQNPPCAAFTAGAEPQPPDDGVAAVEEHHLGCGLLISGCGCAQSQCVVVLGGEAPRPGHPNSPSAPGRCVRSTVLCTFRRPTR